MLKAGSLLLYAVSRKVAQWVCVDVVVDLVQCFCACLPVLYIFVSLSVFTRANILAEQ